MRNILVAACAAGLAAFSLAAPVASGEWQGKIHNSAKLDWLELRTMFAASDGPVAPGTKANQRATGELRTGPDALAGSSGFELFGVDLQSTLALARQHVQLAAKFASKQLSGTPSTLASMGPERSGDWQHES